MNLEEWKQEVTYCSKLVEDKGNHSVPAASIKSYLEMQAKSAYRDGQVEAAQAIEELAVDWMGG